MSTQRHIAVFGLSANPPTHLCGHGGIVRALAPLVDELWVLPVFQHAFSAKRHLAPFYHRLRMCELGLTDAPAGACVRVLDTERGVCEAAAKASGDASHTPRVGSVDVLDALSAAHPDVRWSWILGADTFADLRAGRWKQSDAFMQRVHLFVVARPGQPLPDVAGCEQLTLVPVPGLADVSSSAVRAALAAGGDVAEGVLHSAVRAYVREHALYGAAA